SSLGPDVPNVHAERPGDPLAQGDARAIVPAFDGAHRGGARPDLCCKPPDGDAARAPDDAQVVGGFRCCISHAVTYSLSTTRLLWWTNDTHPNPAVAGQAAWTRR